MNRSKTVTISTIILCCDLTLRLDMDQLLSYARVFEEYCGVCLVDLRAMNIANHMMNLNFRATNAEGTYLHHSTAGKMTRKENLLLSMIVNPDRDVSVAEIMRNTDF